MLIRSTDLLEVLFLQFICVKVNYPKLLLLLLLLFLIFDFMIMQVNFLTKLVSLRPGKTVRGMIKNVMQGKEEGADSLDDEVSAAGGIAGRVRFCSPMISLLTNLTSFST